MYQLIHVYIIKAYAVLTIPNTSPNKYVLCSSRTIFTSGLLTETHKIVKTEGDGQTVEVIINFIIIHSQVVVPSNEALLKIMIRTKHLETERLTLYNLIVSTLLSHENCLFFVTSSSYSFIAKS